jgi:phosphoribosylglycinamide formyltransferase-1
MKQIAIFASGTGTNAQAIIEYFKDNDKACISLIASNNKQSGVLKIAADNNIKTAIISKEEFSNNEQMENLLKEIDLIVLAGFLLLIPEHLVESFPKKIINIHPALLPKYGGKGMYGIKVHEAVKANNETETGITIHYVNEHFDEGEIIEQHKISITKDDSPIDIQRKVQQSEHQYFAKCIEKILS